MFWVSNCLRCYFSFFFFNDTATTEIYTLSLHDALPISAEARPPDKSATSATRLSPLAPPEIHGRSLLPPPPRSLLQEPPAQRLAPVRSQPPAPAPAPYPPLLKTHETGRRILIWVTLTILLVAAIGTVFVAVTRH